MKRLVLCAIVVVLSGGTALAGDISFDPSFTATDLQEMTKALGDVLTFPNLGTATPSGVMGFEALAAAGGPRVDTGASWFRLGPGGTTVGKVLVGQRLILRKGLPAGIDVGAQLGSVMGQRFWGGEVRWALLEGGMLSPGVALRATYSRLESAPLDKVDVAEGQLCISKGFAFLSPYAAVGYRRISARATFGQPVAVSHSADSNGWTAAVGLRATLFPVLHVVGEVRPGSMNAVYLGVGVGL